MAPLLPSRPLMLVSAALLVSVACSETGLAKQTDDPTQFSSSIEVSPARLDFGSLADGEQEVLPFTITNKGRSDLQVATVEIEAENASFTLLTPFLATTLTPDESVEVDVVFSPLIANEVLGSAWVFSDDPEEGAVEVSLTGTGVVPELEISPEDYDFGQGYVGCDSEQRFTLTNVGTENLVIDAIEYTGDDGLVLDDSNTLPLTLAPTEFTSVWVDFAPTTEGVVAGELLVESNDPRGWVTATQAGDGVYVDEVIDTFEAPTNPPIDLLFAVDQSCSMGDNQAMLTSNFSSLIADINTVSTNWQIGVVTADSGCFNQGILTQSTANYETSFTQAVSPPNYGGTYTEALLYLANQALQRTGAGSCNAGFLRPDALLHIIVVSDEPDQSPQAWGPLVTTLEAYPTDPSLLRISAIAGDYPGGCATAAPGDGYYQAVGATGGTFLSICAANWSSHVEDLASTSVEDLLNYDLSDTPDPSTLTVTVDGTVETSGWTYDSTENAVVFDEALDEGAVIEVEYSVLAHCEG